MTREEMDELHEAEERRRDAERDPIRLSEGGTGATSVAELIKRATGAEPMTEARAREILKGWFDPNKPNELHCVWSPRDGEWAQLEAATYSADQLEAIAWWMRNKKDGA